MFPLCFYHLNDTSIHAVINAANWQFLCFCDARFAKVVNFMQNIKHSLINLILNKLEFCLQRHEKLLHHAKNLKLNTFKNRFPRIGELRLEKSPFYFSCLSFGDKWKPLHAFQMSCPFLSFISSLGITKMPTSRMIKTRKAGKTNCFNLKLRTGFGTFTFRVSPDDEIVGEKRPRSHPRRRRRWVLPPRTRYVFVVGNYATLTKAS